MSTAASASASVDRWAVTPAKIDALVNRLVEVTHPSRIILFGSAARGELSKYSDVDLLVVLPVQPESVREVERRIDRAVADIPVSKDILVVSEARLAELGERPSLVYREALREGVVVYEAPGMSPGQEVGPPKEPSEAGLPHWWLEHARKDLAVARLAHDSGIDFAEAICFHAQQAAEKAVKAVLLDRNIDVPYTHDLEKLVGELTDNGLVLASPVDRAEALTRYAVKIRHPNTEHEISDENIADALLIAEAVVAWAGSLVPNAR